MKRPFLVLIAFISLVTVSLAFTRMDGPYKNLKVLPKDITPRQMDSVMEHYSTALGVKCGFCHVKTGNGNEKDFASDDNKHKLIARDMIRMTDSINDQYFNYTGEQRTLSTQLMVNCYTCHHGNTEPPIKPAAPAAAPWTKKDTTRRN